MERSTQRRKTEKRNVLKDIPQDVTRHVNKFLGPNDRLSEVNSYFYDTVDPNHCIRNTQYGLACLKNMTNLRLNSQCYSMCAKHFQRIVTEWFNMIPKRMKIMDTTGTESFADFSSMTAYDENKNPVWSTSFTHDIYFGTELVISEYKTNLQYGTRGIGLGTYLNANKWMIPYKNLQFRALYRDVKTENIAQVFGQWTNGMEVDLERENFTIERGKLVFEFEIENEGEESVFEKEEIQEQELEKEIKEIDCENLTRDAMICTNNLFEEVTSECDTFCQEFFLDGVVNLLNLVINMNTFVKNTLYVDVLMGFIMAYELSMNWNMIILDKEDILLETDSENYSSLDINDLIHENNWSKILIGFPKSEKHQGIVTKLFVKTPEEVIRLKGFTEDESHVILTINNSYRILMEEPD
jgi:hypothetical protein